MAEMKDRNYFKAMKEAGGDADMWANVFGGISSQGGFTALHALDLDLDLDLRWIHGFERSRNEKVNSVI